MQWLGEGLNRPRSSVIFGIFSLFTDDVNAEQEVVVVVEDLFVPSPFGIGTSTDDSAWHPIGGS